MTKGCLFGLALLLLGSAEGGSAQALAAGQSSFSGGIQLPKESANPNCQEWKNKTCHVCSIETTIEISVKNKTKTPILLCQHMKPGPAQVVMSTHAEPTIPGLWEVEFGLGYRTATRTECPHQFIASNHLPLKMEHEIGPVTIKSEIPTDGMIEALVCVGLSSARAGGEGKESGASLRIYKLSIISE